MQEHIEAIKALLKVLDDPARPRVPCNETDHLSLAIGNLKTAATNLGYHNVILQQRAAAAAAKPEDRFKHRKNHLP